MFLFFYRRSKEHLFINSDPTLEQEREREKELSRMSLKSMISQYAAEFEYENACRGRDTKGKKQAKLDGRNSANN